jgi:hypothetical protein
MNNEPPKENPHKPLFNSILSILFIIFLIFISAKSPISGLVLILVFAIIIMAYIQEDDPEKYVPIIDEKKDK